MLLKQSVALLLAASMITFNSCKKEESGGSLPPVKRIAKIQEDATHYTSFEYNNDGSLKKVSTVEGTTNSSVNFTYGNNKQLTEATLSTGEKYRFVYAGNQLDSLKVFSTQDQLTGFFKYTYANFKISKQVLSAVNNNVPTEVYRSNYTYSSTGDLTVAATDIFNTVSSQWEPAEKIMYNSFDDKINPYSILGVAALMYGPPQIRNVLEEKEFDEDNNLLLTTQNTFTYDNDGYPLTKTEKLTPAGGTMQTRQFTYTYQ